MNTKSLQKILAFLMLFLVAVVFYLPRGDDYDLWWHLEYAQLIFQHGVLTPDHSIFSWTPAHNEWKYVTWIGSSIFYLLYKLHIPSIFFLLNVAILALIFYLYRRYLNLFGRQIELMHILAFLLLVLVAKPLLFKPEVFSFLFFAICSYVYVLSKTKGKSYFYLYPPLFLVWVNTHGVFVFGYLLIILLFAGELLTFLIKRKEALPPPLLKSLFVSLLLSGIALCINPYGIGYLIYLFRTFFSTAATQFFQGMIAYTSLWSYLSPENTAVLIIAQAWYLIIMFIFFIIACLYSFRRDKHLHLPLLLANGIIFLLSMQYARNGFLYPTLWLFSTAFIWNDSFGKDMPNRWHYAILVVILLFGTSNIMAVMTTYEKKTWFAINYEEWVPKEEADFIKMNKLPAPLFNDYLSGGYLIWRLYPDYKVFIDPRYAPYDYTVMADWATIRENLTPETFKGIVDKYKFRTALIHYKEQPLIDQFSRSPEWKLVYFGNTAAVFIKKAYWNSATLRYPQGALSAERFSKIDDPVSLIAIFNIYSSMLSVTDLHTIRDIYQKNVFEFYVSRASQLAAMDKVIRYYEQTLGNSQCNASPIFPTQR